MRTLALWLSILLLAGTVGWFWLLSHDLRFTRVDQIENKPPAESKVEKTEAKKGK